jgi:hypothetical protein
MGLFSKSPIGDIAKEIGGVVDDLHYSGEEKAKMKLKFAEIISKANLAQMDVNKQEAKNGVLFVSGWRPFVGWTCGCALAWTFVLSPILQSVVFYVAEFSGQIIDLSGLPTFDLSVMMPVLLGMLGLGGLRTYEKVNGAARVALHDKSIEDVPGAEVAQNKAYKALFNKPMRKGKSRGS